MKCLEPQAQKRSTTSVNNTLIIDIFELTYILAEKRGQIQAPYSYQMQQWLSQSDKEDSWTSLSLAASSAANSAVEDDPEDILKSFVTQYSTQGSGNAYWEYIILGLQSAVAIS